jgi:hypothetical protein
MKVYELELRCSRVGYMKRKKTDLYYSAFLDIVDTGGNVYAVAGTLLLQVAALLYIRYG